MRHDRSERPAARRASRGLAVLALVPVFGLGLATSAYADVSAVSGSAFGAKASLTLPVVGTTNVPAQPTVTLPANGAAQNDSSASVSGGVLSTGVLTVHTEGTLGAGGSVTSSATVTNPKVTVGLTTPLQATTVGSTCTSNEAGSTGSTTVADLKVLGAPVSVTGAPNQTVSVAGVGTLIINEQVTTGAAPSSGITVNALHLKAGVTGASGDIIIGQSVCGVTGTEIQTPSGAVGGVLLSGLVAVAFVGNRLWRRRRPSEG